MMTKRMVVLWHEIPEHSQFARASHFDLMLESEVGLLTWSLKEWPLEEGASIPAERLADHRMAYLDYEGPISGNRGSVQRREQGTYEVIEQSQTSLSVAVKCKHFTGILRLEDDRVTNVS